MEHGVVDGGAGGGGDDADRGEGGRVVEVGLLTTSEELTGIGVRRRRRKEKGDMRREGEVRRE